MEKSWETHGETMGNDGKLESLRNLWIASADFMNSVLLPEIVVKHVWTSVAESRGLSILPFYHLTYNSSHIPSCDSSCSERDERVHLTCRIAFILWLYSHFGLAKLPCVWWNSKFLFVTSRIMLHGWISIFQLLIHLVSLQIWCCWKTIPEWWSCYGQASQFPLTADWKAEIWGALRGQISILLGNLKKMGTWGRFEWTSKN